jgi:hypothetical protein
MIKQRNLDPALIAWIEGMAAPAGGNNGGEFGETFYLTNADSQQYSLMKERKVDKSKIFHTFDEAMGACVANRGDTVKITPNYTETITGAGGMTLDKAGVLVQGYGRYDARPTFLMDGASVSMLITAANVTIDNVKWNPGHADLAYLGLITAKGTRISNCMAEEITTDENWVDVFHVSAADNDADGLELINNEFLLVDDAVVTAIDLLKNINDAKIIGNRIIGDFNATPYAPIYMADGEIAKNVLVLGNLIHNLHDDHAAVGISMVTSTSTGWMMFNHCYALDVAGETPFLTGATGIYCSQNYYTYQATLSGFEYPAIGTLS